VIGVQCRVSALNERAPRADGAFVLYWMEHSQRAVGNPALEHAAQWANRCGKPLVVLFVVDPDYPEGNARHFTFMLDGLAQTLRAVERRGAHASLRIGRPADVAAAVARKAAVVIADRGYLRHLVAWREEVARAAPCRMEMVEGDVIVPVEVASQKPETAARTIRPKLHRHLPDFRDRPQTVTLDVEAEGLGDPADLVLDDVPGFVDSLGCDMSVPPVTGFRGGTAEARRRLKAFVDGALADYDEGRSDIVDRNVSQLSPYLHLGQISPLDVYHAVAGADAPEASRGAYIEEMLVRRELAVNFVRYAKDYDSYSSLPQWARDSLAAHRDDQRESVYTARELEEGRTDDPYWNAAMREMRVTGYLHNHMRMYWGKRFIAYTNTPEQAYRTALHLNNKYLLDGRDANSYANIGWLFGLHDRGWPERAVFGKVRTMTAGGLERKFDIDAYVRWADSL